MIIPALNEAGCLGDLVAATLAQPIHEVVVVDNGSTDDTAGIARRAGARVVTAARRGYGYACAAGAAGASTAAEALVFMDGDFSFAPDEMPRLLTPLEANTADLVLGSRVLGSIQAGSMPPPQRFGNWLWRASWLGCMACQSPTWGHTGPCVAICWSGWTCAR